MVFKKRNDNSAFTKDQENRESGGRQFDSQGKPLVGRYRDGSTPSQSQRAYGVAQMQIGTAREAAKRAGITWDEQAFFNDPDYNRRLGNEHMTYLRQKYNGDTSMAEAAYHSGEGTVDKGIATYGKSKFYKALGPEGLAYIGKQGAGGRGTSPTSTPVANATEGEKKSMAGNQFQITDPYAVSSKLSQDTKTFQDRTQAYDDSVLGAAQALGSIRQQQTEALTTSVDARREINSELQTQTKAMIDQARPIFQKRQAIRDRQQELAGMNPLARAIKGTFDPNYNEVELRAQDGIARNQLAGMDEEYKYVSSLQGTMDRLIAADYATQNEVWSLQADSVKEDLAIMAQSVGASQAIMNATTQGLENQMGVIRAQAQARQDTLSQLSPGQVNEALSQAQASPDGHATINGVPLGVGELSELQRSYERQSLALEGMKMGLETQRLSFAQAQEDNLIENMTYPQVQEAIKNGGQFNGVQLDVTKLNQYAANHASLREQSLNQVGLNSAPGMVISGVRQIEAAYNGTNQRMIQAFGQIPEEQRLAVNQVTSQLQMLTRGLNEANARGVGQEYAAQAIPQINALLKQQSTIIDNTAKRWAGNDKDLQAVGVAWLKGEPLSSDAAVRGLIKMARNGAPPGTRLTGPAKAMFDIATRAINAETAAPANTDMKSILNPTSKESKAEKEAALIKRVSTEVRQAYSDQFADELIRSTPRIAQGIRVNGRPHPFNQVSQEDFATSVAVGDEAGFKVVGGDLGLSPSDVKAMFKQGTASPIWQRLKTANKWDDNQFGVIGQKLQEAQAQSMLQALDASDSAKPGFRPSQAYSDLLNDPNYQARVGTLINQQGRAGFGDFLAMSAGSGASVGEQFRAYASGIRQSNAALSSVNVRNRVQQRNSFIGDPTTKLGATLTAMDGLDSGEIQALSKAVVARAKDPSQPHFIANAGANQQESVAEMGGDQFGRYSWIIRTQKFEDPAIEAIRKKAASQWPASTNIIDRLVTMFKGN